MEELRRAAEGRDLETALAAKDLLDDLDAAFFHGGRISLEVDRSPVNWDEPFALTVVVHNPTAGPIRVPWATPASAPAGRPDSAEVRQVAAMFDVADFLIVQDPDGQTVDLRVDPIDRDAAVRDAVESRATGTARGQVVEPGRIARLRIAEFNRGWARFPMLRAGRYRIALRHQPLWKDEKWVEEQIGVSESPPVEVEIRQGAPESIREANRPMVLVLSRAGEEVVAELHNTWDRPQSANLNVGPDPETQASIAWRVTFSGLIDREPVTVSPRSAGPARDDKMPRLAPDGRIELGRVSLQEIRQLAGAGKRVPSRQFMLSAVYQSFSGPEQLRATLAARNREARIPNDLFSGLVSGNELRIRPATATATSPAK